MTCMDNVAGIVGVSFFPFFMMALEGRLDGICEPERATHQNLLIIHIPILSMFC